MVTITRPKARAPLRSGCSIETTMSVLGGRWKSVVLYWLVSRKRRFSELRRMLANCTQRVLTLQLRELERDGLITRTVFAEVPPRVEYELTPLGRSLEPLLRVLGQWGMHYTAERGLTPIEPEMIERCADR
jgi:DNA-binding HxlR family transcriptional regulator